MTFGAYLLDCLAALALILPGYGLFLARWKARQKGYRHD